MLESVMDERSRWVTVMGQREVKDGSTGNHRGNKDHKKMASAQTHNND
jgi:hypothetical protein